MSKVKYFAITILSAVMLLGICATSAGCSDDYEPPKQVEGTISSLQEAYEQEFLTHENLQNIAYYHNNGLKYSESLSDNQSVLIRQSLVNELNKVFDTDLFDLDNIRIYNGGDFGLNDVYKEEEIDGVKFAYSEYTEFFHTEAFNFDNTIIYWKAD